MKLGEASGWKRVGDNAAAADREGNQQLAPVLRSEKSLRVSYDGAYVAVQAWGYISLEALRRQCDIVFGNELVEG